MAIKIKKVKLNNSFRKGTYFRVYDNVAKVTRYYKYSKGNTKRYQALNKYNESRDRSEKRKFEKEKNRGSSVIDILKTKAILHFRVDYGKNTNKAFEMKDSYIRMKVDSTMSKEDMFQLLEDTFFSIFSQQIGAGLINEIEVVEGLETNVSGDEEVVIVYKYSFKRSGNWKTIKVPISSARRDIEAERKFLANEDKYLRGKFK